MQRKERKTLTKENYAILFEVVCQSKQPLSSYEIKNEMHETRGRYVYEMINKLVPLRDNEIALLSWNKVPKKKEKFDLVRILRDFFHLDWVIDFDYNEEALTFKKSHDDKVMTIENANSNTIVVIERDVFPEHEHLAIIRIIIKGYGQQVRSKHVYIRKKGNDKIVTLSPSDFAGSLPSINYLNYYYRTKIDYLNHTLDHRSDYVYSIKIAEKHALLQKADLLRSEFFRNHNFDPSNPPTNDDDFHEFSMAMKKLKEKDKQLMKEMSDMTVDRRRWRYSPNIRTLIKYLLAQIRSENEDTLSAEKKARIHNKRTSNILANLSVSYPEEFPFLLHYFDFQNEYDRLKEHAKLPKYYEVELLKQIAQELGYQVDSADIDFLKYWVTRRYSGELSFYFISSMRSGRLNDAGLSHLSFEKIRHYILSCLDLMKRYMMFEHSNIKGEYESYLDRDHFGVYF
jgi:hypothetical protein